MDKKVWDRRRAVNRERGRRRVGVLALIACLIVSGGLFLWLRSTDVFAVKRITATALEHVSPEDISKATASVHGESLLKITLGGIAGELRALPYVRSVKLHRQFPHTLEISIEEYQPLACIQDAKGGRWLVAAEGRVLEKRSDPLLPLVVPESPLKLEPGGAVPESIRATVLSVAAAVSEMHAAESLPKTTRIGVATSGEVTVTLEGGAEIRLGDVSNLKEQLRVAAEIIQRYLRDNKTIEYIDARVPERPAVKAK